MIHRLKKKFILINMSFISIVLVIVFTSILFSNYNRLKNDSILAMHQFLQIDEKKEFPMKPEIGRPHDAKSFHMVPVILVLLDDHNTIKSVKDNNAAISDELLNIAVSQALASGRSEGLLTNLDLRYIIENKSNIGTKIVFADITHEKNSLKSSLINSSLIFTGAFAAFFIISLFLSGWALKPVEQAFITQKQFIADASHELKTPLTVILANVNILLSHRQNKIEQQLKWIENTKTEAERMKKLVDDLLFLAKSDAENLPLVMNQCNVSEAAWSCLLPFESIAFEQEIQIHEYIEDNLFIIGNENQLKQLIMILLDNACKYAGKKGTVTFLLEKKAGKIQILVNNSGTFIPQEDLEHIFERFYRSDKSRVRKKGGYGLGLAIAKSIAENHHAKITASSSTEQGTTFKVLFTAP